jgi:hypothetical protein
MATGDRALLKISPTACGYTTLRNYSPQYWNQWGRRYVVIEPVPDDEYALKLFIADYPSTALVNTTDVPTELPEEFRGCIVDFACYVLSIKLRRWKQAAIYYNTYIRNLKIRNAAYMKRKAEQRAIHKIPDNVKGNTLRKEVDARSSHKIPDNVVYQGGRAWAH